jgi:hypothetical protein
MNTNTENVSRTFYFGLSVEIVHRMEACSLIRFSGRDLIVDTADLASDQGIPLGPTGSFSPEPIRLCQAKAAVI